MQKRIEAEKIGEKDGKALHKLMNNSVYGKTMENLRNRIDIKFASNKTAYLKWAYKPNYYMLRKIFDNDLATIRKSKLTLTLNKPAYIGMGILPLSKVLMYEFHYDYIKNKHDNSRLLFTDTDNLMYEIKNEDVYEDFTNYKEIFDFNNYSTKSKYYDI